ncbi:MAG: cyclic peptide export ABC transporter [Thermoanaerobaculia bacterium]
MKLLELLRKESSLSLGTLLGVAAVAGLSNALVLAVINVGAAQASHHNPTLLVPILFLVAVTVYSFGVRYFMATSIAQVELVLDKLRVRLADKVRRFDLEPLEHIGKTVIYAAITNETGAISQSAQAVVVGFQAGVLVFFTAIYVAMLSRIAFALTAVTTLLIAITFIRRSKELNREQHDTMRRENDLFDLLTHLLEGFKEVRLNRKRSDALFRHFVEISDSATRMKIRTMAQVSRSFTQSQVSFYLLMGVIVFIVPRFSMTYADEIVKIAAAVLFVTGPLAGLIGMVPAIAISNAAVENIERLEETLDRSLGVRANHVARVRPLLHFREISLERVVFSYEDESGATFTVGPIDFKIVPGETVFIAGGNGSGKSTFLKLFTGLYFPQEGVVRLDGVVVDADSYDRYRSLFSTVFTDFHLFDRLYGLYDVPDEEVERRLDQIEMRGKTHVIDSAFDTLDLSGGQRKRLALLISMLEDRAIYVFDEMAADQDPPFRRKFYKEIVPLLKKSGKTIVAVTHDDKYFEDADRLLKMDEGKIDRYELAMTS